jgi:hypothetical protein
METPLSQVEQKCISFIHFKLNRGGCSKPVTPSGSWKQTWKEMTLQISIKLVRCVITSSLRFNMKDRLADSPVLYPRESDIRFQIEAAFPRTTTVHEIRRHMTTEWYLPPHSIC